MRKIYVIRFSAALAIFIMLACSSATERKQGTIDLENVALTSLSGDEINFTKYNDKIIFINFWATWCRPCVQELPSIAALKEQLTGKNIEFFFASNEEVDRIQKFMVSRKMNLNFVRVENLEALGVEALPTTMIFDGEGNLLFSEMGFRKWDEPGTVEMVMNIINKE